jgi:hypothetical protein
MIFLELLWNLKVGSKNNKGVLNDTIPLSLRLRKQPPGLLHLLTRGPCPWSERGHEFDRPNPATVIAGGEGGGAWEHHHVSAHL